MIEEIRVPEDIESCIKREVEIIRERKKKLGIEKKEMADKIKAVTHRWSLIVRNEPYKTYLENTKHIPIGDLFWSKDRQITPLFLTRIGICYRSGLGVICSELSGEISRGYEEIGRKDVENLLRDVLNDENIYRALREQLKLKQKSTKSKL